jgi:hypothetical protein
MAPLSEWQTLLAVQAGAAATLTGLVFVAVSINLAKIIAFPGLPSRAAESIVQFLQVFFICTTMLIPRQPGEAITAEILAIALSSWVMQVVAHIRYARARSGQPLLWLIIRMPAGLYWLVPGFIFSFVAGVANAWVLLIEVVR